MTKGRLYDSWVKDHVIVHPGVNVSSSAHDCGCVVDVNAMRPGLELRPGRRALPINILIHVYVQQLESSVQALIS